MGSETLDQLIHQVAATALFPNLLMRGLHRLQGLRELHPTAAVRQSECLGKGHEAGRRAADDVAPALAGHEKLRKVPAGVRQCVPVRLENCLLGVLREAPPLPARKLRRGPSRQGPVVQAAREGTVGVGSEVVRHAIRAGIEEECGNSPPAEPAAEERLDRGHVGLEEAAAGRRGGSRAGRVGRPGRLCGLLCFLFIPRGQAGQLEDSRKVERQVAQFHVLVYQQT
mmetsp:Transcript_55854/g.163238  ORF Transcript_55854/g.163238 Transcript_55854/m.163238 type:complete len:226 (+) Transcript_55854:643-1320(+)